MISPCLRIAALVLCLFCFAIFAGVASTVVAQERPAAERCCNHDGPDESGPMQSPCTDANCLCFSCQALDVTSPLPTGRPLLVTASVLSIARALCPEGFTSVIDYPPETA